MKADHHSSSSSSSNNNNNKNAVAPPLLKLYPCSWCQDLRPKQFTLETANGTQSYCSEKCFTQCRRAVFKRNQSCDWCHELRPAVSFVDLLDGQHQLQFCSDECLAKYKMDVFCRETKQYVDKSQSCPAAPAAVESDNDEQNLPYLLQPKKEQLSATEDMPADVADEYAASVSTICSESEVVFDSLMFPSFRIAKNHNVGVRKASSSSASLQGKIDDEESFPASAASTSCQLAASAAQAAAFLMRSAHATSSNHRQTSSLLFQPHSIFSQVQAATPSLPPPPLAPLPPSLSSMMFWSTPSPQDLLTKFNLQPSTPQFSLAPLPLPTAATSYLPSEPVAPITTAAPPLGTTLLVPQPILIPIPIPIPIIIPIFKSAPEILEIMRRNGICLRNEVLTDLFDENVINKQKKASLNTSPLSDCSNISERRYQLDLNHFSPDDSLSTTSSATNNNIILDLSIRKTNTIATQDRAFNRTNGHLLNNEIQPQTSETVQSVSAASSTLHAGYSARRQRILDAPSDGLNLQLSAVNAGSTNGRSGALVSGYQVASLAIRERYRHLNSARNRRGTLRIKKRLK